MAIEELEFGPRPVRRRALLRLVIVVVVVATLVLVGLTGRQVIRRASPQFDLDDLNNSYAAFTTNNGSNNVSVLHRANFVERPAGVKPSACGPLIQPTVATQFPVTALDGVLVYSIGGNDTATSLYTFRYAKAKAAREEFRQVQDALARCDRATIKTKGTDPKPVVITEVPVGGTSGIRQQAAYLIALRGTELRLSVHLFQYGNTVTWQYRYGTTRTKFSPQPAQDLMDSLVTQMRAVLAARE